MHQFIKISFFVLGILGFANPAAFAKSSLNSMCYVQAKPGEKVLGQKTTELFELASVSKIFTSYWAVRTLGTKYRFTTQIHITPLGRDLYDVHIQGTRDPFWGRQLTHLLFAELNKIGIVSIRRLSFDENFTTRWNVITDFLETISPSTDDIKASFVSHIAKLNSEYPLTYREAAKAQVVMPSAVSLNAQEVEYVPSNQFSPSVSTKTLTIQSAPLYRYLKEVNRVSNNHVADKIFDILGGASAFKTFAQKTLSASEANLQFVNGSGNSVVVSTNPSTGASVKEYNRASCETTVRVVMALRNELKAQSKMDLQDVMAVSSADDSTLSPRYDALPNSVVAKTGTVDPAITLTGMISTGQGDVYFGVLYHTDGPADWNKAKDSIRGQVFHLMSKYGGQRRFEYAATPFLTFDAHSGFATRSSSAPLSLP